MKITTLIPAYKPKYLVELLTCLRNQTVKPARIIVSDDSPDQAFVAMLSGDPIKTAIADLNVQVLPGPRSGAFDNFRYLLDVYAGSTELFHFLLDDDILYPPFYEKHLAAHASGRISCSISRRWTAVESGLPIRDLPVPEAVDSHPNRMLALDAAVLFSTTAALSTNWLGELSNAVFAAELTGMVGDPMMNGVSYKGLEDLGAFLNASLRAPVGYINSHLGYFRTSGEQNSANPMGMPMKLAHLGYLGLAIAGKRAGKLTIDQTATCLAHLCPLVVQRYGSEADMAQFCELMPALAEASVAAEDEYLRVWNAYSAKKKP